MPHQISISATTGTPPYSVIVCDVTLIYCYTLTGSTSLSATTTFDIPSPLDVADSVIVKVTDSNGCEIFLPYSCPVTPTPTPTITPTPTPTPTGTCRCIQVVNTGTTGGTFYYTQCDGVVSSVLPISSGTTLYYCGSNPIPLTECDIYIGNHCISNSCVAITPTPTPTPSTPPILCFTIENEFIGIPYDCSLTYVGFINGKPYYVVLFSDCSTTTNTFVYWNNISNRWEHIDGSFTLFSHNNNPGYYPESNLTYPWASDLVGAIAYRILFTTFGNC